MYIRVCVDDDVDAARQALGKQVLNYAMATPGTPLTSGYRGLFAEMGFGEVLSEATGSPWLTWSRLSPTNFWARSVTSARRRAQPKPSLAYRRASTKPSCAS